MTPTALTKLYALSEVYTGDLKVKNQQMMVAHGVPSDSKRRPFNLLLYAVAGASAKSSEAGR
jgi:hypothetical protein